MRPPLLWGSEARVKELFSGRVRSLEFNRKHHVFQFHSAQHFLEHFRAFYGPTLKAFEALAADAAGQESLASSIEALAEQFNTSNGDGVAIPSEYLEIIAVKA